MNYRSHRIIIGLLCVILLTGCEANHHNYYYVVRNSADTTGNILLTYSLNGVAETQYRWLEPDESLEICERKRVSGDDVWNIETSAVMYAVPALVATNRDADRMTEELAKRSYWPAQPENRNDSGFYVLKITDDLFVLEKQNYYYHIHNMTDDSLFVTSSLLGDSKKRDTIVSGQTANIGNVEIFTYNENLQGSDKYMEKKLSGISSLTVKYREYSKNIDFKKYKSLQVQIEKEKCTLIIDQSIFN